MSNTAANPQSSKFPSPVILAVATQPERRVIERSNIGIYGATLLQTGIGPAQVRSITEAIVAGRPAGLISIGTAGGLDPELPPGRLLMPLHVITEDGQTFAVSPAWHTRVHQQLSGQHIETGKLVSVTRPVRYPHDKQVLKARTGAIAVDMESAELARIALNHSIPFLIVRAIADPHDQELPLAAMAALTSRGDTRIAGLLGQLLRRPGDISGLIRLNTNFRAACRTLNACCHTAGKFLCDPAQ